jgi:hypothetical protein
MTRAPRLVALWPWLALVAATLAAFLLTEGAADARLATTAVILIAAIKVRLVVVHFMETPWAARPCRLALEAWIVGVTLLILIPYWFASA